MQVTGQKLSGIFSAASMVMVLLFAGNWLVTRGDALPEDTAPPETEISQPTQGTLPPKVEPQPEESTKPGLAERLEAAMAELEAEYSFVSDGAGDLIASSCGSDARIYPASITKLYTACIALQHLDPDTVVTAGEELELVRPGSSKAFISRGCRLTVKMLLEGMLLPSGNDAAYILAAAAGRAIAGNEKLGALEAVQEFVAEMNREAQRLGFENSHFTNPDGYHAGSHYSCAADIGKIAGLVLAEPVLAETVGLQQVSAVFQSGEWIDWYNHNLLLDPTSAFYEPGAVGMKTGYTSQAGYCLLGAFREGEETVVIGVFGARSKNGRYEDAAKLLAVWQAEREP